VIRVSLVRINLFKTLYHVMKWSSSHQ
jgi:hypothetical protein